MQQQDQVEKREFHKETAEMVGESASDGAREVASGKDASEAAPVRTRQGRLDRPALIAALAVAAFFALTARMNSQPAPSYLSAALFSATGCGLLVTAIRKLRRQTGAGLLEAALGGFGLALLQFAVAFTYPGVLNTVTTEPDYGRAFLITWGLIALFAVVLSLAGAAIGHMIFAPSRSPSARIRKQQNVENETEEGTQASSTLSTVPQEDEQTPPIEAAEADDEDDEDDAERAEQADEDDVEAEDEDDVETDDEDDEDDAEMEDEDDVETDDEDEVKRRRTDAVAGRPSQVPNYAIAVLLLGLAPMMAGYVFAACYDFVMNAINVNAISPALYPTLSVLIGLLPWRLSAPITLSGTNGMFIVFTLLWRVPDSVLGNPNLFDVQALETLVFNSVGLALLLLTRYGSTAGTNERRSAPMGIFLFLEALFGLILVLPANLWLLRGLEGVLQLGGLVTPLPTIQLLNPVLFILNLLTGMFACLIFGLITRRQYQLWTAPRAAKAPPAADAD